MLAHEVDALRGGRVLLATDMVRYPMDAADPSHLLITRPTESNALESFVLQRAEDSAHMAMLVSPYMLFRM